MIQTSRTDLSFALKSITQTMQNTPAVPILAFARFQLTGEYLYIDAGSSSGHSFARIPASGKDLVGCVDPRLLMGILPMLPEQVELKPEKNKLLVKRPTGNVKLATADPSNFPDPPSSKDVKSWIKFPREAMRETIKTLLCGTEETNVAPRLWQNVAQVRCTGDSFTAISSDGQKTAIVEGACEGEAEILVPIPALKAIYAIVEDDYLSTIESIEIGQDERRVWVRIGDGLKFMFVKIDCKFPDISGKVLGKLTFDRTASFEVGQFNNALKLVRVIAGKEDRGFRLEAQEGQLSLFTASKDRGEASETIQAETGKEFESFVTGYNADYLVPVFAQVSGRVSLEFAQMHEKYYPLKIVHQGEHIKSVWLVQSRNIYPGSPPLKAEKVAEVVG